MVGAGRQSRPITGHVVLLPSASPHRALRLVTDVDLLLAATIANVRMNQRQIVFEPPASLAQCARCHEAYAEARRIIEQAGGVEAWVERTRTPTWGVGPGPARVRGRRLPAAGLAADQGARAVHIVGDEEEVMATCRPTSATVTAS
jgi:hypothetical protein